MPSHKISRREALKTMLAISGGIGAAAFLPAKWVKPLVSVGVLPVHAATSTVGSYQLTATADTTSGEPPIVNAGFYFYSSISTIRGRITSTGGLPVANIPVTLSFTVITPNADYGLNFDPNLPVTVNTDASGIADFGELQITSCGGGWVYQLNFNAVNPPYTISPATLGNYTLDTPAGPC